jgi:hypothetical protein
VATRCRDGDRAAAFAAKIAWEQVVGPLPFTAQTLAVPVVFEAHTYGAIGGLLAAAALCLGQRPEAASL